MLLEMNMYEVSPYIRWALMEMLTHCEMSKGLDREAVGAAKVIRLAAARRDFEKRRIAEGKTEPFKVGELYEAVKDIWNA